MSSPRSTPARTLASGRSWRPPSGTCMRSSARCASPRTSGSGDRVPHRGRSRHRRPASGVRPAVRHPGCLDADHRRQQSGIRRRDRGHGPRAVLRRRLAVRRGWGGDIAGGASGQPCWVEGTVIDTDGKPVGGARIEVWEADEDGFYDVQYDDAPDRRPERTSSLTEDGAYRFWGLTPHALPDPGRRSGRPDAVGDRPLTDAGLAPALHGARRRYAARWSPTSSSAATSCSPPTASSG